MGDMDDYVTDPGDPGLAFEDLSPPDLVCPSCHGDSGILAELRLIRMEIAALHLALRLGKREAKIYASLMDGMEPRVGFWRRLFRRSKARWIEWRNGDRDATATGNNRCREDVWAGRKFVGEVEAEEGTR